MARESAHRRRKKKRRRGRLGPLYLVISSLLVVAAVLAGCVFLFKVAQVKAEGAARYTAEQLAEAAGVRQGDNLILLNKGRMEERIFTALPYVDQVSVRRRLPDTLLITVTECYVAAAIETGEDTWLIDPGGKLLERTDGAETPACARVSGLTLVHPSAGAYCGVEEEDAERRARLLRLLRQMEDREILGKVTEIDLSSDTVVTFVYDGRYTVELPAESNYSQKLYFCVSVMEQLRDMGEVRDGKIDLTREEAHFIPGPAEE